jgi:hypothetical protein
VRLRFFIERDFGESTISAVVRKHICRGDKMKRKFQLPNNWAVSLSCPSSDVIILNNSQLLTNSHTKCWKTNKPNKKKTHQQQRQQLLSKCQGRRTSAKLVSFLFSPA